MGIVEFTAADTVEAAAPVDAAVSVPSAGRASFIVGVTSHRNLQAPDLAAVLGTVDSFFGAIAALLPDTEIKIMLGMAAGGDLAVAQAALERGLPVEAVLPMPVDDYTSDFDDRNRTLLMRLLSHPNLRCTLLPAPAGGAAASTEWRIAAYRNLRDALVDRSNLMLALWDGRPSARPGGTTETVLRCLRVRMEPTFTASHLEFVSENPGTVTESPFVYWIPIAPGGTGEIDEDAMPRFLTGHGDTIVSYADGAPAALKRRLEELNDYNRDYLKLAAGPAYRTDSLLARVPAELAPADRTRLERVDFEYGKADALAMHYQWRSDSLFGVFGTMAFLIGSLYLIYDKLGENRAVLITYLVISLGSLLLHRLLHSNRWFVRHLGYRALAETLRVKFYLCLAGVDHRVDALEVMALSGIERFDGFSWIGYILKSVDSVDRTPQTNPDPRRAEYVNKEWVENQFRYFVRKVAKLEHNSKLVKRGQLTMLLSMIAVLLLRMSLGPWLLAVSVAPNVPLKNLLLFCVGIGALFLGVWKFHQSKMATRELTWQYKNQLNHFSRIRGELERTASSERRSELLAELGKRSLMESYLWTIHRYHREHAPPSGG